MPGECNQYSNQLRPGRSHKFESLQTLQTEFGTNSASAVNPRVNAVGS